MIDALWITLLGMGITFFAILVLWGMMAGLTVLPFKDNEEAEASPEPAEVAADRPQAKVAAVAVAVALAEQEFSSARPLQASPLTPVSAWQLGTRSHQLYEQGKRR